MSTNETYNGWTNRETWAVALHINNDQGWQESVLDAVRDMLDGIAQDPPPWLAPEDMTDTFYANRAGDIIRENVEQVLDFDGEFSYGDPEGFVRNVYPVARDIGSLWRVNWTELGAAFLADLAEDDA